MDQPIAKGYYSKIINRKIVTSDIGAKSCTVWDQIIPPGGYIVPHYHEFEESLTFLTGCFQVTIEDEHFQIVDTPTTLFIRPYLVHSILNQGDEPVQIIALLMSASPKTIYLDGTPEPVNWEVES